MSIPNVKNSILESEWTLTWLNISNKIKQVRHGTNWVWKFCSLNWKFCPQLDIDTSLWLRIIMIWRLVNTEDDVKTGNITEQGSLFWRKILFRFHWTHQSLRLMIRFILYTEHGHPKFDPYVRISINKW